MIYDMIKRKISLFIFKKKWRKKNSHNRTAVGNSIFNDELVEVGKRTYGQLNVLTSNRSNKLKIGNFCSIGPNVCFIPSSDHYLNIISTFPYQVMVMGEESEAFSKGDIILDDDVWIGYGATILSGVHIGQGAVIAAGAVVSKDVPPYAIVGGVPAKLIKYRFSESLIDYLLTFDYSSLTEEIIKDHIDDLYIPINDMTLEDIKLFYSWFPKKGGSL